MNRKWGLVMGMLTFFLFIAVKIEASAQIAVIVNAQNPILEITVSELRSIYYGQKNFWADGSKIEAVDLEEELPERKDFSVKVFNLNPDEVERKYVKLAFSGTGHPPAQIMSTSKKMLYFVAYNRSAIGYIDEAILAQEPELQFKIKVIPIK